MTKIRSSFITLLLLAGAVFAATQFWSDNGDDGSLRRDCVKWRTSNATMTVRLSGRWGGGPATISHSVTDQGTVGPFDAEAPYWTDIRKVRACDLIVLFVTPTAGAGTTTCRIAPVGTSQEPHSTQNRDGGPVRCVGWYTKVT